MAPDYKRLEESGSKKAAPRLQVQDSGAKNAATMTAIHLLRWALSATIDPPTRLASACETKQSTYIMVQFKVNNFLIFIFFEPHNST